MSMRTSVALVSGLLAFATTHAASEPTSATATAGLPERRAQRPNVLVWMMDDVGFGQICSYGGLVQTPNIERVAKMGLSYSNYHTAPICSASRAAFLTGRMPHSVHIGGHATAARPLDGYDAKIPASAGTIAANLHQAGYATFALGKWDHLPAEDASPAGPFTYWPVGQGFDRFYGFLTADADNWNPVLIRDHTPVAKPADPTYHLSADLADQAVAMIDSRDSQSTRRPFFMYWATGAAHAPHHAPREWLERYRGKFDAGWDKIRDVILKSEHAKGLVPKGTRLAAPPEGMPAWDSLSADQKRLYARQMEAFAAALSHADAQFGRILDALQARGELDNTLIIITSDNGASAEGGPDGLYNEAAIVNPTLANVADNLPFYDTWGGPQTFPHYSYGWAVAGDTPFRYYKQTAHEGGTRVPLVIAWPKGIAARGEVRDQFAHVSDVAPTILDAVEVAPAATINDVPQAPMEGVSIKNTFLATASPREGRAQYVELYGNKGLWWQGWSIVTTHRFRTWDLHAPKTFDEPWELYDLVTDPGQTQNLAAQQPGRVATMSRMFDEQAQQYHVYPIQNLSDSYADSFVKARADFERRGGKWRYRGTVENIPQPLAPPINSRGFVMTAKLELPVASVTGPLFAYGGQLGGMGLYLNEGKLTFILNSLKGESVSVVANEALRTGTTQIELELAKGNAAPHGSAAYRVTLSAAGRVLAQETIRFAIPAYFGIPEVFGVGSDVGSPVLSHYPAGTPLPGRITDVVFDFTATSASLVEQR